MNAVAKSPEIVMMEVVGAALKQVVDQFNKRLAQTRVEIDAEIDRRFAELEKALAENVSAEAARSSSEIAVMEVVGTALNRVVEQFNARLAGLEKLIASYAPADVTANLIEALKTLPAPQITMPELKFLLEMPPRESEKTIEYDHRDRPVNIKEKQVTVKED